MPPIEIPLDTDVRTEAAWTEASATDRLMFSVMANPAVIDREAVPSWNLSDMAQRERSPPRFQEVDELAQSPAPDPERDERAPPTSNDKQMPEQPVVSAACVSFDAAAAPACPDDTPPPAAAFDAPERPPAACEAPERPAMPAFACEDGGHAFFPPSAAAESPDARRTDHVPPATHVEATAVEQTRQDEDAKRSVLLDIYSLEQRGVRMTKQWTMDDRLEDMMLEVRRHALSEEEKKNVDLMKDGLRFFVSGVELLNKRIGILDLDGWAADVNRTMDKHDQNLHKIYRKYWTRGSGRSPELDIAMSIASSMGMHHMKRMMTRNVMRAKGRGRSSSYSFDANASSSDSEADEGVPAARK